ncbi:hypothetical protein CORC01_00610 [Colletotrichum orchidophilum]|uniref:Uncharacterized protein n=1 Tax=Colletotrichum orchidophilum TaxID=1209926 RepID=A0A1G4BSA2_9PEZI|nr:uncharacterized protein CORC01_00610 [Colletotrichum orchidophilum]OHF04271.1 hypothetical protein CORC01_00610 [Colletotrichum orchidophilum]
MSSNVADSESQPGGGPSEVDYSNTRDLDLANILYVQNIPVVPDTKKNELDACIKSINSWLAWELTRVEKQVENKIKSGELPGDESIASKSKRTAYRSKVVSATRELSPWLPMVSTITKTSTTTAGEDKISLWVLHSILGASGISDSPQALNVVKAMGAGFHALEQTVQPHVFYVIEYGHDTVSDIIVASIKSFIFKVQLTETSAPAPTPAGKGLLSRGKSAVTPQGKLYAAAIEYINTSVNFDFNQWNQAAPQDEASYAVGKQLVPQKQLRLLKDI